MNREIESRSVHYLRDLLLGLLPLLIGIQCLAWITFFPEALKGHADFRQLYAAGYIIRTGHAGELYSYQAQKAVQDTLVGADEMALPFIRPAYQGLLFVPFSLFSYRAAYLMFLGLNLSLCVMIFWLLRPMMNNLATSWGGLPFFVFLVFYPIQLALVQGQDSIILLLLLATALAALHREREMAAGALVGLGLFKLQIVIPIAVLFLLWKRGRFTAGFAVSACILAGISVWTTGLAQTPVFMHALLSVGGVARQQLSFPLRVSIMANLRGLIVAMAQPWLSTSALRSLTILSSAALLTLVALTARKQNAAKQFLVSVTAGVVVSYYLFIHDLSILLLPITLVLNCSFATKPSHGILERASAWTAALLLVAPMCIFLMPRHFYLVVVPVLAFMVMLMLSGRREAFSSLPCFRLGAPDD
jgi:hypothetical protein